MLGLGWMLDKLGTYYFGPDAYNFFLWLFPLFIIYFPKIEAKILKKELKKASSKIIILSLLNVLGYWLQLKALALAEATRVILIVQSSVILTIFLGAVLLKEKENFIRKILAGLLSLLGVYFLIS